MLDGIMKTIRSNVGDSKFRVFANFGNTYKKSSYINVRDFVPCIESMSVSSEHSTLRVDPFDSMEALKKDTVSTNSSTNTSVGDDEDW
jgi:hypothetical protein